MYKYGVTDCLVHKTLVRVTTILVRVTKIFDKQGMMQHFCVVNRNHCKMSKVENKGQITVTCQDKTAQVRIIGEIGWENNAESFRQQCDDLLAKGVKDVSLYINTRGGDCFDANEIVNILSKFPGKITGEGGALVASAGTYIAAHCHSFTMPANGLFMVHKPSGSAKGRVADVTSFLKLLTNLEKEYLDTYNKLATDPEDFMEKWEAGDYWMTATEAKEAGFITGVKEKATIDRQTAMMIAACCPATIITDDLKNEYNKFNNPEKMDKAILTAAALAALKVTSNVDDATLSAAILDLHARAEKAEKELMEQKEKTAKAIAKKAIEAGKFPASDEQELVDMIMDNPERAQKFIDRVPEKQTVTDKIKPGSTINLQVVGRDDWDYKRWLKEDPKGLQRMKAENPDAFEQLKESMSK